VCERVNIDREIIEQHSGEEWITIVEYIYTE
jgi:hypothetical protein